MLHRVDIANENGDILTLPLGQPTEGIILTGIDGLDPGKAILSWSEYAQQDGSELHSTRRESRNILMGFALDSRFGSETVRQLRQRLYQYIMPETKVYLTFHLEDGLELKIDGHVESLESPMFSQKPVAVVSIICPTPDFYNPEMKTLSSEAFNTLNVIAVDYRGSVPGPLEIQLEMNAGIASSGFTVYNRHPNGDTQSLIFSANLQGLDIIRINSTIGQKSATLIRSGVASSIMAGISPKSVWPTFAPGENQFAIIVTGSQTFYEIDWYERYGGM